jgi:heme exporter protein D
MFDNLNMDAFFGGVTLICSVMIVVWLLRIKSKGTRAYLMACAFAAMGAFAQLVRLAVPMPFVIASAVVVVGLLAADALLRIKEQEAKRQ